MPKSGARLPKSEATRLKLLDCAVEEILEVGPDRVGFTSIARRAELSTGALYARFENVDELLLEVWIHRGLPSLRRLLADMEESLELPAGKDARRRIAEMLSAPQSDLCLLVNLFMIARRNEVVGEFLIPTTVELVNKALVKTPAFDFYLGQILGIVIGVQGTGLSGLDWMSAVSIVASSTRDANVSFEIDPQSPAIPETGTNKIEIDDIDSRLFAAVSRVISSVGVDHATISRIARHADINPASIYVRYEDKDALLAACIAHTMTMTYGENDRLISFYKENVDLPRDYGTSNFGVIMFRGNHSAEHQETRRLRLETMFGASHHEDLKKISHDIFMELLVHDEERWGVPSENFPRQYLLSFLLFSRFSFFGYAILREFGFLLPEHRYLVSFFEQLGKRILSAVSQLPRPS